MIIWMLIFLSHWAEVFAQEHEEIKTLTDPAPFVSLRAAGMAQAISPVADGIHAPYYNPAGIGGLHWRKRTPPVLRRFHFPYIGGGMNENSRKLQQEFAKKGGMDDRGVGQALLDAESGKRQYARFSSAFNLVLSRFTFLSYSDYQLAAFRKESQEAEELSIATKMVSRFGVGMGVSAVDDKGTLYLGLFTAYDNQNRFVGDVAYNQLINSGERVDLVTKKAATFSAMTANIGFIWMLSRYWRPSLAVVVRDLGGSHYKFESAPDEADEEAKKNFVVEQDVTLGFSVSPNVGKKGAFNLVLEAAHLTNDELAVRKKLRMGLELTLGGFGSEGYFGLRSGVSAAGLSYGVNFNFGLVQLEMASQAVDLGRQNKAVAERRNLGVISVNVLDN